VFELLVVPAVIRCDHDGRVETKASQDWVTVAGHLALRDDDPERREIDWCPNRGANIKRCSKTERVEVGYSVFITLGGRRVVLASLEGKTNGTPPKAVHYRVREPGQRFVVVEH
jgi:hypothetical protein